MTNRNDKKMTKNDKQLFLGFCSVAEKNLLIVVIVVAVVGVVLVVVVLL